MLLTLEEREQRQLLGLSTRMRRDQTPARRRSGSRGSGVRWRSGTV